MPRSSSHCHPVYLIPGLSSHFNLLLLSICKAVMSTSTGEQPLNTVMIPITTKVNIKPLRSMHRSRRVRWRRIRMPGASILQERL